MMKRDVRIVSLVLAMILALALMMTGCGEVSTGGPEPVEPNVEETLDDIDETEEAEGPKLSHWTPMSGNRPVNYFLVGGIDWEYHNDEDAEMKIAEALLPERSDETYFSGSYAIIDGLIDEEVEAAINDQIYNLYRKLCEQTELPGYRGVKTVQRNGRLSDVSVYPWNVSYSGSLISVGISKCWTYIVDEEDWYWIRDFEYLTFDVKTGGIVTLESLFGDNVDYMEVLNEQVKNQLPAVLDEHMGSYEHNGNYVWDEGDMVQLSVFEGIREDQPFSIDYQGINLYFDEKDPEFDTEFGSYNTVTVYYNNISKEAVYPVRFAAEEELFEQPLQAMLVYNYDIVSEGEHTNEKNLDKTIQISWPADMSVEDRDKLIEADRKKFMEEVNGWYINNAVNIEENYGYLSYYCSVIDLGGYYNVEHNLWGGCDGDNLEMSIRRIYNQSNMKEIPVDNVFMPGYDLRSLLIDEVAEAMVDREGYQPGTVVYTPEEAWDGRMGSLSLYGISFDFPINDFGGRVSIYKRYSDLGLENLKPFQ